MNYFNEVKQYIKPTDVANRYIGQGKYKAGSYWYKSPFRKEKTASFSVSNKKGLHDFGDSKHYDVISFTQKLFDMKPMEAIRKLVDDFNLPIDVGKKKPRIVYEREYLEFKKKVEEEKFIEDCKTNFYNEIYNMACENYKRYRELYFYLQDMREIAALSDLCNLYTKLEYWDNMCEYICNIDKEEVWERKEELVWIR